MIDLEIRQVLAGAVKPLGKRGVPSGMDKKPVAGRVRYNEMGLVSDAQGDMKAHGGVDKAIHHYPFDHYASWRAHMADEMADYAGPDLGLPGAFGENISVEGLRECDVALGDIFRLGSGVVQICQGRQPCWKLNERFGNRMMAKMVQQSGMTGWYYRVLEPGEVAAGDRLVLQERPAPEWRLNRITALLYEKTDDYKSLEALVALPFLAASWRRLMERRLERREVEDWGRRLNGVVE